MFIFFKQKTAYEMRISDWSSDVCSSDLSYPETTGFIIPTFYRYWHLTGRDDIRARAVRMADWECAVQHPSGGVLAGALGDSPEPTVFNTGQVLFGWVRAFEAEGTERYREAALRAATWLCAVQDAAARWRRTAHRTSAGE